MNQKEINLAALRYIALHISDAIDSIQADEPDFPLDSFCSNFIDRSALAELLDQCGFDQACIDEAPAIGAAIYSILGYSGALASYLAWERRR